MMRHYRRVYTHKAMMHNEKEVGGGECVGG